MGPKATHGIAQREAFAHLQNSFWIAVVLKVTTSWKESSLEVKLGPTIMNQRVNTRVWFGNIIIHPPRKSLKHIQPQESLCLQFLEHYQGSG